jgi:hypothetical protein
MTRRKPWKPRELTGRALKKHLAFLDEIGFEPEEPQQPLTAEWLAEFYATVGKDADGPDAIPF